MKIRLRLKCILAASLGLYASELYGHDVPVHQAITFNAAESAYTASPSYHNFEDVISSDLSYTNLSGATNAMIDGSGYEDNRDVYPNTKITDVGGKRSLNHFYDPLDTTYNKGLSDSPPDRRIMVGTNSFAWASVSNGMGYNFKGVSWFDFGRNVNKSNIWSWQNARGYEWLGLTATDQLGRQTNLDNMFRAVGQVMHLLEDTSQPQHVRNEQHVDKLGKRFWESPIEDYGQDHWTNLNYGDGSMLNWTNAGFTKLQDFWDRHLYNGSAAALNADTNGGTYTLGLAEWCNGNFLGDRLTYAESFYLQTQIKNL